MIITVFQYKGGTGKTTSVANLAGAFSKIKKEILLIDADPQAHLTNYFKVKQPQSTLNDLLLNQKNGFLPQKIRANIDIIPSNLEAIDLDLRLAQEIGREFKLSEGLSYIKKNYDVVLIDTSPFIGITTVNTLVVADYVLIPVQPEYFSATGLALMLPIIEKVKKINKKLKILGAFISRYDKRTNLHKAINDDMRKNFPAPVLQTIIRENIAIAEASAHGKTIFEYAPNSHGAEDYQKLFEEINKIIGDTL